MPAVRSRLDARTFCRMAAAHAFGLLSTRRVCTAAALAAALRVTGCPAAAWRFSWRTVLRIIVGTARTAGRVALRLRKIRVSTAAPRTK